MDTAIHRRQITKNQPLRAKQADALLAGYECSDTGIYPLDAPGIDLPGPSFLAQAQFLETSGEPAKIVNTKETNADGKKTTVSKLQSSVILNTLHRLALRKPKFTMPVQVRANQRRPATFIPGHLWGQHMREYSSGQYIDVTGPQPANVMVIGKMPGKEEIQNGRCLVGESGKLLVEVLRELHIKGTPHWYVTNLCKFAPPDGSGTLKAGWIKDCLPLLQQELRIVRPKVILCLGADASKALLGKKCGVDFMEGRVYELTYPVHTQATNDPEREVYHTALVMTVVHPAAVNRAPDQRRRLERGLARFDMLVRGIRFDLEEKDIDHRSLRTLEELESLLYEIDHDPEKKDNWISVDAEWHGEHPQNAGSYVRLIQFAWRPKHAAALVWSNTEGNCAFFDADGNDARPKAIALLNRFFANKRICGHFLVADLEWLCHIGLDAIRKRFRVRLYDQPFERFVPQHQQVLEMHGFNAGEIVPAWASTYVMGGWDTGLAGHAIEETAQLGLEYLTTRYTTVPRYDIPLSNWKEAYCKEKGIKAKDLEGYGPVPDEILLPYGLYDADATMRLMYEQIPLIDRDYQGNCCRESFWESMLTTMPILEMHQSGILVDKNLIDEHTRNFMTAKASQEMKIQTWAKWPDFNIRSVMQVREFLFGEKYNGKITKTGEIERLRPPEALTLNLDPILDTSKPPKQWREIREKGLESEFTPGTSKTILGALAQDNPAQSDQVQWLRDHRFIDQVLKSVLRPPRTDDEGNIEFDNMETDTGAGGVGAMLATKDNLGNMLYDAGLASVICDDDRIRTHFYPTTETKRWRSARPPLQNMAKRRDADYERILGDGYKRKLRAVLMAAAGYALVEADFKSAELFGMAIMSGDEVLLDHCFRNQLPENDPDYYDIHSNIAVLAFGLNCAPTKDGLKSIGKVALRVGAKNVIFGLAYGRGAKAIALQCKEEGNPISVEDAQRIIDMVLSLYPGLVPFFAEAQRRSREERWLCSCFGAFRRFPYSEDRLMAGEFERQAMNFPIQSMIASAMDRAVAYIQDYRDNVIKDKSLFRMLLQIHDAVILEVPYANIERVAAEVLPVNMTDRVEIWQTDLAGVPTGVGPYHMGVDIEVYGHWGEKLSVAECVKNGIPLKYAAKEKSPKKVA